MKSKERKTNKFNIILIVLLSLAVLGLGSYIIYDKVIKENGGKTVENNSREEEDGPEVLDVISELVTNLVDKISFGLGSCRDLRESYLADTKFNAMDFSNEAIYELALRHIYFAKNKKFVAFTADSLEKEIENIVGSGYNFEHIRLM